MPQYTYQVLDKKQQLIAGKSAAESQGDLVQRLKNNGYTVLDVQKVGKGWLPPYQNFMKRRVGLAQLDFFSRQLASMLAAGMPISRALMILYQQAQPYFWRQALGNIVQEVESGTSLSDALGSYPSIFSPIYIDMIRAGEISGDLQQMLMNLSKQLAQQKLLRDQIRTAVFYPVFILTFAGVIIMFLVLFLMPAIIGMLPPHTDLPLFTQVAVAFGTSVTRYWFCYVLLGVCGAVGIKFCLNSRQGQYFAHRIKFKIPLLGSLWKKAILARFSRLLAFLLAAGVPVLTAFSATVAALGNVWLSSLINQVQAHIQGGARITDALAAHSFFPPVLVNMVEVGEESGYLPELLHKVADFYEEEVAMATRGLTALIEPILIVVVGLIVGFLMLAIYLPLFTAVTAVGG